MLGHRLILGFSVLLLTAVKPGHASPRGSDPTSLFDVGAPRVRALVFGPVHSLTFEVLKKNLDVTEASSGGLSGGEVYDVLVFDGKFLRHRLDRESLRSSIEEALKTSHWVLGLDLSEQQKRDYFFDIIGLATKNSDATYLARRVREAKGSFSWRLIGSHPMRAVEDRHDAQELASLINGHLTDPKSALPPDFAANVKTNPNMPSGLPSVSWYSTIGGSATPITAKTQKGGGGQNYSMQINCTVTEYYDNVSSTTPFEWLVVAPETMFNPTAGGSFAHRSGNEQAFIPIKVISQVSPDTPEDFNNVTLASTFPIPKPPAVAEWGYTASSSNMTTNYTFMSTYPDADKLKYDEQDCPEAPGGTWWACGNGTVAPGYPQSIGANSISILSSDFPTTMTYSTATLDPNTEQFQVSTSVQLEDFWVDGTLFYSYNFTNTTAGGDLVLYVDMTSVVPSSGQQ